MKAFDVCTGHAAVIARDDIDTDLIVRIERISQLVRGQFQPWAFETLRYRPDGSENPDFVLNQAPFRDAKILLTGANFGCGSSREMAVWALDEFGIRCVIASSYGDIFYSNCFQNGVLPIRLAADVIATIMLIAASGAELTVDLNACLIRVPGLDPIAFSLPESQRVALLNGQDDVDLAVAREVSIVDYQKKDRVARPWVYA
ncbi:3-isopropylmalate dehydratase small subunit [Candidatus Burkholderia verschuerenii]|uniref:3-isopropylmalate dehydratase n=1 Tax=Candidatus Burkholderia verschuerenii TaxID=242163 RepID=A0A0L0MFE5_9BURK|nr:3-isopropylmalate dehydratase small subunit [Candidatus Burkholderia verschuerenii]KND61417.1 3-isopropylmalate dehydratase small subunit [Candidatus Burkholderia verschuerenii]